VKSFYELSLLVEQDLSESRLGNFLLKAGAAGLLGAGVTALIGKTWNPQKIPTRTANVISAPYLVQSTPKPETPTPTPEAKPKEDNSEPVAWGAKVSKEFKHKVFDISEELGIDPN